jgi:tetratricopeptide (TPR) repeat protein
MQKVLLVVLVAVIAGFGVQAQPTPYRLRVPTAQEYIRLAPDILETGNTPYVVDFSRSLIYSAEVSAFLDELDWRFLDNNRLTYNQLKTVYGAYQEKQQKQTYNPLNDFDWTLKLLRLWLVEHPTDLSNTPMLQFDDYSVEVKTLEGDFKDLPYQWGYWLRGTDQSSGRSNSYIAIPSANNQYTFPALPVPIESDLLASGNINSDEYPDIAYFHSTHMGNSYNSGDLVIVSLHDRHFEMTSSIPYSEGPTFAMPPAAYTWRFLNLDKDMNLELLQTQQLSDNWRCKFVHVSLFDWQENGNLGTVSGQPVFPKSFNCLLRQAEQQMWNHHYPDAIPLYEAALKAKPVDDELYGFAQVRLGLAYLLTGQADAAKTLFTSFHPAQDTFEKAAYEAYQSDPRLLPVCQAMYDYVAQSPYPDTLARTGGLEIYDGGFYGVNWPGFNLENASCDLSAVLTDELTKADFVTSRSPVEQLKAMGLKVGNSIAEDFDLNGKQEWLVWPMSIGIDPIFFYPNGTTYQLSRLSGTSGWPDSNPAADLRLPDAHNQYSIVVLPDNVGKALVDVDFSQDKYSQIQCADLCGGGGPTLTCPQHDAALPRSIGDLTMWRVENGKLVNILLAPLCEMASVEQLFPDGEGSKRLIAGDYKIMDVDDLDEQIVPAIYHWDSASEKYILAPQATPTASPTLTPTPIPTETPIAPSYQYQISDNGLVQLRAAFKQRDFSLVKQIADSALSQNPVSQDRLVPAFRYYRALALEALNRPDAALAEYIAIAESQPDSAWAKLADLHLEQ